jgi:hypothetical protein
MLSLLSLSKSDMAFSLYVSFEQNTGLKRNLGK